VFPQRVRRGLLNSSRTRNTARWWLNGGGGGSSFLFAVTPCKAPPGSREVYTDRCISTPHTANEGNIGLHDAPSRNELCKNVAQMLLICSREEAICGTSRDCTMVGW